MAKSCRTIPPGSGVLPGLRLRFLFLFVALLLILLRRQGLPEQSQIQLRMIKGLAGQEDGDKVDKGTLAAGGVTFVKFT
jgi:hypothetical protein